MFETYKFHGLYIAIQAVLTLYAQGICLPEWLTDLPQILAFVKMLH